jgi:drug/metabolite transporter (DMT)-like permease
METSGNVSRAMSLGDWARIGVLAIVWGGSFFFIGVAVKGLPPFTIVALRVGIAAMALHLIVLATGQRMPSQRQVWLAFLGMGLIGLGLAAIDGRVLAILQRKGACWRRS